MDGTTKQPIRPKVAARFFDGRSARPHTVQVWQDGENLYLVGESVRQQFPLKRVHWAERTRHGPRVTRLPGGAILQSIDARAWDDWRRRTGHGDGWVVMLQQSWRAVALSLLILVVVLAAGYVWGLPWVAREVARRVPDGIEEQVGQAVMAQLNDMVHPSTLSAEERNTIESAWNEVLQAHRKAQAGRGIAVRPTQLMIRASDFGPNALALPGGTILLTDDLVRLVRGDTKVLSGVLAHELGHVQYRHGMQTLVQVGALGVVTTLVWGDFSGILATVPMWLGQAHYSREAEREADGHSVAVLRDAGISPLVMVTLFERFDLYRRCGKGLLKPAGDQEGAKLKPGCDLAAPEAARTSQKEQDAVWGLGFASHPADAERMAFFRAAAR